MFSPIGDGYGDGYGYGNGNGDGDGFCFRTINKSRRAKWSQIPVPDGGCKDKEIGESI